MLSYIQMIKRIFILLGLFTFISCALYEPQYRNPEVVAVYPTTKKIEKSFFLIGDGGKSPDGLLSEGLEVVQNYLKANPSKNDYAIFLGDNIYPDGMPPLGAEDRKHSEYQLDAQLKSLNNFDGTYYFIPGNHDWYNDGLEGLKREEDYLLKIAGKNLLQPANGCPIASEAVTDNIQLIMIDTQWYLEDWNKHPTVNENCDIKTREKFFIELEIELEKHRNKTIVFTMHHPMFTNGTHGGYFALDKHLYPTQKKIPLPVLSSLVTQIRAQGGVSIQDRYNELYNNLMKKLGALAKKYERVVFASGHEHTLQYHESEGLKQIVSGSASKESAASLGKTALFVSGAQGFAKMDVFEDGSSWVQYFIADASLKPKMVFQKELFVANKIFNPIDEVTAFPEEIETSIFQQDSLRETLFFNTVYGRKFKDEIVTDVTVKVAMLDTLYGGLTVERAAGKKNFKALRLRDKNGRIYRMRALKKNALAYDVPFAYDDATIETTEEGQLNEITVPDNFTAEFFTASHPYALMAVPKLAQAADIFFTAPSLYYIPKQNTLGLYNEGFGDELYYISIEPSVENDGERIFSYPIDIETTDDILIKIREQKDIQIDEESYITSRLFDMMIGDWDREPDHWRWAEYFRNGKNLYVPIPKNRDDAFASFDGNILDVARSLFTSSRQTHAYKENFNDLQWFNEEGVILDRAVLQRSGLLQWKFAAEKLQSLISDDVIEQAFNDVPEEVQSQSLEEIKTVLKARRDNITTIANTYYNYLSNLQTITGTDDADYFEITRLKGGLTNIKVYRLEGENRGEKIVDRTLEHSNTREVWIYGLDGNDTFITNGVDNDLIYIRIIGGKGIDTFDIVEGRRVKFYDTEAQTTIIDTKNDGELIFTNLYDLNTYDYRKNLERNFRYAPAIGYNPDDGFRLGLQTVYTVNSFKRNPFSKRHVLQAGYYFDTQSYDVEYKGEFANSIGDSNLSVGARFTSPNYTINYFGYGNETVNSEEVIDYDYNRIQLQQITAKAGLIRNSNFGSVFSLYLMADSYRLQSVKNNLYQEKGEVELEDTSYFSTLEGKYDYRSFDDPLNPKRGMVFNLTAGLTDNLVDVSRVFGYLKSKITFYNSLVRSESFVLKTNVQAQFNFGNKFEFYQGVQIGANNGLRGFREERFTGKSSLTASADVRYSFPEFQIELLPIQVGVFGGVDVGRVWTPSGNSERWHNSRGGGLWVNGSGGLGGTLSVFNSTEGTRVSFGLGFNF